MNRLTLALSCLALAAAGCTSPPALELPAVQLARVDQAEAAPLGDFLCHPPEGAPPEALVVTAAPGQPVRVGSREVVELLGNGAFPLSSQRGMAVAPLAEALELAASRCPTQPPGRLLLALDERLPWESVQSILHTAGQARYDDLAFLVSAPEPWHSAPPPPPDLAEREPQQLVIAIEGGGVRVHAGGEQFFVECEPTPCADAASWSQSGLRSTLAGVTAGRPLQEVAVISPSVGTPWAVVAATGAATAWTTAGEPSFSRVVFTSAPDDTPIGPAVPAVREVRSSAWALGDAVPVLRARQPEIPHAPAPAGGPRGR